MCIIPTFFFKVQCQQRLWGPVSNAMKQPHVTAGSLDVFVSYELCERHCVRLTLSSPEEIDFLSSVASVVYLP